MHSTHGRLTSYVCHGQGYSAISGEDVSTNVTMAGLVALTNYTAYCYTEDTSTPANKLGDTAVASARVKVRSSSRRRPVHS